MMTRNQSPGDGENADSGMETASRHAHELDAAAPVATTALTKNEALVWAVFQGVTAPLKAYGILDLLKDKGVRAPMTVYRALDGLERKGFIHKLDALNAFLPCNHDGPHTVQAFLVCEKCPTVEEIELNGVEARLLPMIRDNDFHMRVARLEVKGLCRDCLG